ncbi:retrovirus-related pol polyprotein from transposon TNT 1-94 [Tanacetum coccineum]|uniref:Retrovirus-related pol polyprotein from transposon TNT 1-94 n=1 Tax=Tanacetum coccineum TaxID=301880 RepID=A0ABQ5AMQ1_9ASTR
MFCSTTRIAEQAFWFQMSNPSIDSSDASSVKVDVPSELPKVSLVNASLKKLKFHLTQFDSVVKQRITPDALTKDKRCLEIANKQALNENDRLLEQIISQDIVNIVVNSSMDINNSVNVNVKSMETCNKCLELEAELIKQHNMVEKDKYNKLLKNYSKFEQHCISLEIAMQLNKENFQTNNTSVNQTEPTFDQLFELNNLKAELQEKNTKIKKLKAHIKRVNETSTSESVKKDIDEIETINIELEHRVAKLITENEHLKHTYKQLYDSIKPSREKVFVITKLKNDLMKLKGNDIVDNAAHVSNATTIAPRMYKLDPVILAPWDKNNRETHIYYLKHTMEQAAILSEIVEQAKSLNPLDSVSYTACKYVKMIQELLGYVRDTFPDIHTPSKKLVAITPINKKKTVRFTEPVSSPSNIPKMTNRPLFNEKNKVEDYQKVKSSLNKKNSDSKNVCNEHVKHSVKGADALCSICNECLFDANHAMCLIDHVNSMNVRAKSASKKNKKRKEWKPTGKVFNSVGYKWKPTGRTFTLVENAYPLTRITATHEVPIREPIPLKVVAQEPVVTKVYTRRPKIGNVTTSRVYYVKGLRRNLFSVGQFCDSDLEVAFRKQTCFVCNLEVDYSQFTWSEVILATKELSGTDNGTEFVNQTLEDYYETDMHPKKKSVPYLQPTYMKNHEYIHVEFDELRIWLSEQKQFRTRLHENDSCNTPVFDEFFSPLASVASPDAAVGVSSSWITATHEVPIREPIPLKVVAQEPVVTKVYTRRPNVPKTIDSNSKPKIVKSLTANKTEPDTSQGSNTSVAPSSSSLIECRLSKLFCGNVTISRVYYVKGLGLNLFSVKQFCDSDLEVAFRKQTCFVCNLEGVDLLSGSQGTNMYSLSIGDMMASSPIYLLSKATKTKSWLWHHRLSHLNFGAINHLARHGLVRGLPKLKFEKDHLYSACAIGKSKKQSHKPKSEDTNEEKLYLLYMDLCGHMRVASVNGKKYILVIVDDYSRFTWVKFLASKDEAPDFIIKFLKMIQVRLNATVRNIRTDNGTEFVNQTLRDYYEQVDISHKTLIARTPQQNGVVERRNRTLLTAMASEQSSLELALHEMTHATPSSGLVPNPPPFVPFVPPSRHEWDLVFQLVFDEFFSPPASVASPNAAVEAPAPVDAEEESHSLEVAHMSNDPYFGILIPKTISEESSSMDVIHTNVHSDAAISEHFKKWTKDHPLRNIIGELSRPDSIRLQLYEQALFCYYDAFLSLVEPKTYKDALTKSSDVGKARRAE